MRSGREPRRVATYPQALPYKEYEEEDDAPRAAGATTGGWELVALLVLVVAGLGLPLVGWAVGIVLVHQSRVWTRRDAWLATSVPWIAVAVVVGWSAVDAQAIPLHLGPGAVLILFGGAIAGLLGGAYLTVRAFLLA